MFSFRLCSSRGYSNSSLMFLLFLSLVLRNREKETEIERFGFEKITGWKMFRFVSVPLFFLGSVFWSSHGVFKKFFSVFASFFFFFLFLVILFCFLYCFIFLPIFWITYLQIVFLFTKWLGIVLSKNSKLVLHTNHFGYIIPKLRKVKYIL